MLFRHVFHGADRLCAMPSKVAGMLFRVRHTEAPCMEEEAHVIR